VYFIQGDKGSRQIQSDTDIDNIVYVKAQCDVGFHSQNTFVICW